MKTLTLDIDGVVAGGYYVPEWDRKVEVYEQLPLLDPRLPEYLDELCRMFHVYFVSSRKFPGALACTRRWLSKWLPLYMTAGVIVGLTHASKPQMVELLGSDIHVDDDPRVIGRIPSERAIWFVSGDGAQWPAPEGDHAAAHSWNELMPVLRRRAS